MLKHDVNKGGKHVLSRFGQYPIASLAPVFDDFNLICIFELTCPVKKLHSSAQSETALNVMFSVWALQ